MDTSKAMKCKILKKISNFFNDRKLQHEKDSKVLNSFCSMQRY